MNTAGHITRRLWAKLGVLLISALIISVFSWFPGVVENGYSERLYPVIGNSLRFLTSWLPFSIGDLLYAALLIWLILKAVKLGKKIYHKQITREWLTGFLLRFVEIILWIYIIFKLIWGLNYNRLGIEYQLGISKQAYNRDEVVGLTHQLIDKMNECRRQIPDSILPEPSLRAIYSGADSAYQNTAAQNGFLHYQNRSVKASLFSLIGDYLGFSGYYNPFTGEAQVRSDIPRILVPYIACHEMAHQLGYASESEANFAGYLAAAASDNVYFRYSVYSDLFSYAQSEEIMLFGKEKDFKAFEEVFQYNRSHIDTLVKLDRRRVREFFHKRRNSISPAVSGLYDQYLKMNRQLKGVNSYNEVIGWLIAYQKKYGKI